MTLSIRNFDWKHDLEIVCEFHKDHAKINFPEQKGAHINVFKENLAAAYKTEPEGMFILEDDKVAIGFLWLYTFYNKYRDLWMGQINYVHVHKNYRKKGYGKKLLKKTQEYFKVKSVRDLRASVMAANSDAMNMFESEGFKPRKVILERRAR